MRPIGNVPAPRGVALVVVVLAIMAGCGRSRPPRDDAGPGVTDMAADRPVAARCLAEGDCPTGICRDGVCCAAACDGACASCAAFLTGVDDGLCAPVKAGLDPHDECADESGSDPCGNDGKCDGAGACRKGGAGRSCAPASCLDAHTFSLGAVCDGAGRCEAQSPIACGEHVCTASGCAQACAVQADCPGGTQCLNGSCRVKKAGGEACGAPRECTSGFCSPDGVCCDQLCLGGCLACVRKSTGLGDGTCGPVLRGLDPKDQCPLDPPTSCGRDGTCDGAGSCHTYGAETACAAGSCAGSIFTPGRTCNGAGVCVLQRPSVDCVRNACTGNGCIVACHSDSDCDAASYCMTEKNTCASKQMPGNPCETGRQCASGACVDGVCCEAACGGRCTACQALKTGGPSGLCLPVREGTDPDGDCDITDQNTCGSDGMCNGAGQCRQWAEQTICAPGHCDSGGHYLSPRTCLQGICRQPAIEDCGLATCGDTVGCRNRCTGSQDCVGTNYCNLENHTCATQKVLGAACAANAECLSGYCVDGVCCNNQCGGGCMSCRAHENGQSLDGTCGEVVDGSDPGGECSAAGEVCGLDGFCGGGRCRLAPATAVCSPATCVDAPGSATTTFTPAASCDGRGVCPAVTPDPCPGRVVCLSGEECRSPVCLTDQDCVAGFRCDNGDCIEM